MRYLQHWLSGPGAPLHVAAFGPETPPIRQWAETFPWAALVSASEPSCATRFPTQAPCGRRPIPIRVLLALELLKHALGGSDEAIGQRVRTDFAVMYACGRRAYHLNPAQAHFVLPETRGAFRRRIAETLMEELMAIQAAAALAEGLVSPAHLVSATFPSEPGRQRVTEATTLYKAPKKCWRSSPTSRRRAATALRFSRGKPKNSTRSGKQSCAAVAANAEATGTSW